MIERRKLTLKETLLLVLGVVLFFSTAFAITGPLASRQMREEIAAFATDGATTTGKVTAKEFKNEVVSHAPIWRLDIAFKTAKGEDIEDSPLVTDTIYDRYNVGDAVRVTYVRSHPYWFYIPGGEPKRTDIGTFEAGTRYAEIIAGASLLGLIVVALSGRGGARKDKPSTKSPVATPSPAPQEARGQFGTRRRT